RAAEGWYTPVEKDFRPVYMADAADMQKQTWDQYWSQVQSFYKGLMSESKKDPGWTVRATKLTENVKDPAAHAEVQQLFNDLGMEIAKEFSKDPSLRRISYADLLRWTDSALDASEDATGAELKKVIGVVKKEVDTKVK